MIDQLDREYTDSDIAQAVEIAASLEVEDSLDAMATALAAKAGEVLASDPRVAELLEAESLVCLLQLVGEDRQARGDSSLVPKVTFTDGTAHPPYVREWPDTVRPYFVARAAGTTLGQTRARYNDFVWTRWQVYASACVAHEAYLAIGSGHSFGPGGRAAKSLLELGRAVVLSRAQKIKPAQTAVVIANELERALADDAVLGARLITPNAAYLLALDSVRSAALTASLMAAAEKLDGSNPRWARELFGSAGMLAEERKSETDTAAARSAIATSLEKEAALSDDPMTRMPVLRGALAAYQAIPGSSEAVQRLKRELAAAVAGTAKSLTRHKFQFQLPTDKFDEHLKKLREMLAINPFGLLWLPSYFGILKDWDRLKTDFESVRKDTPLIHMIPRVAVEKDGRMQAQPAGEAEKEDAFVLGYFVQAQQISAIRAFKYIEALRESGEWSAEALITMLKGIDPEMAAACGSGIEAFEAGDYWTAVHVLVPQVERALRNVSVEIDGNVLRLIGTEELRVATLGPILEDPAFEAKLGTNAVKSLRGLLTDPRGLNLRNLTAHGLLDPTREPAQEALMALMCVLLAIWLRATVIAENGQPSAS